MGEAFRQLAPLLQDFHSRQGISRAEGRLGIEGPRRGLAKLVVWAAGLPRPAASALVRLQVTASAAGELWERWFENRHLASWQRSWKELLLESFGPWTIGFTLVADSGGMRFVLRRVWFAGLPWPRALAPRIEAATAPTPSGWHVDVRISLPLLGQLVRYHGEMRPQ